MKISRVLIKISGETLSGSKAESVFDSDSVLAICKNIKNVIDSGIGVSIVVGGGNILRGRAFSSETIVQREAADSMGMLATAINGLMLKGAFESIGIDSTVVSNLQLPFSIESSNTYNIDQLVNQNKIVIFVGGTGVPYFSTDTAAVINALISKSDMLLKATKTDGVYNKDPEKYEDACFIPHITYDEALKQNIQIMDQTAFALAKSQELPITIFSIKEENCFLRAIKGEIKHSVVSRFLNN